jgi:hypothetical protein
MIAKAVHHLTRPWWRPWWRAETERASEELMSGLGVVFENTWFLYESGRLWVSAIHDAPNCDAPPVAEARERIAAARDTLQRLRTIHPEIESLVRRVPISYAVVCDYGQGVAPLYCLVGERLASRDEAWRLWRPMSS